MQVRAESPGDLPAVGRVLEAAFGQPDEAELVERLRADGDAALSLVAVADGAVAGHVLFSPMSAPFPALALAPVAVLPERQGRGIGSALIREGLARAEARGWRGVFVLGEPAYYRRFGFDAEAARGFASPYAGPFLMVLPLGGPLPAQSGTIGHAPGFARMGG
ncbi:MAG TPA: N-acetyltransferase [Thermohalobaculum sp.]|nr:N-acetyltransferase [Thermohalobaculum sp.]